MNGPRTNPLALASAVTPSLHVAKTVILVLPKPRMNLDLRVSLPAGAMVAMVPVDNFPRKTRFPSSVMVHVTFVAGPAPVFFT